MAESTLAITLTALRTQVADSVSLSRTWGSVEGIDQSRIGECIESGLRQVYWTGATLGFHYSWNFLRPAAEIVVWPTTSPSLAAGTATVSAKSYSAGTGLTTFTFDTANIPSGATGSYLAVEAIGVYLINSVPSSTTVTISGDQTGDLVVGETYSIGPATVTIGHAATVLTITANVASFYPSMVGKSIVVTHGNSASYTITGYTSSTVVTSVGAAGDIKTVGETFGITADGDYRLPDDFGGLLSGFTFAPSTGWTGLEERNEVQIRQLREGGLSTGTPRAWAIVPLSCDGTSGQRFNVRMWPTPSGLFTLGYRYQVLPDALVATTNENPYGGAAHAETILESCLAIAEQRFGPGAGLHTAKFKECLKASVAADSQLAAGSLGYCGDRSDDAHESGLRAARPLLDSVSYVGLV